MMDVSRVCSLKYGILLLFYIVKQTSRGTNKCYIIRSFRDTKSSKKILLYILFHLMIVYCPIFAKSKDCNLFKFNILRCLMNEFIAKTFAWLLNVLIAQRDGIRQSCWFSIACVNNGWPEPSLWLFKSIPHISQYKKYISSNLDIAIMALSLTQHLLGSKSEFPQLIPTLPITITFSALEDSV